MYLLSYGQISIAESQIFTSRFGTCSSNMLLRNAIINTSGRGCTNDTGRGHGQYVDGCAGSGASNAGIGGYGAKNIQSSSTNVDCS